MSTVKQPDAGLSPLANAYLVAGLGALVVLGVVLLETMGRWALVPTLLGAAGLAFRWRSGALLFLASMAICQLGRSEFFGFGYRFGTSLLSDLILCATAVTYVVSQYRLIGLTTGVFPPPPRKSLEAAPPRAGSAGLQELGAALLAVAVATIGARFAWEMLGKVPPAWRIPPEHWQIALLAWVMLGGTVVAAAVLSHLGWRRLSREEAAIFLQDTLWHETRGEQRRINRWRAWASRRRA
jgi:hypothetical protein